VNPQPLHDPSEEHGDDRESCATQDDDDVYSQIGSEKSSVSPVDNEGDTTMEANSLFVESTDRSSDSLLGDEVDCTNVENSKDITDDSSLNEGDGEGDVENDGVVKPMVGIEWEITSTDADKEVVEGGQPMVGIDSKNISSEVGEVDEGVPMDAEQDGEEVDDGVDSKKISSEVDEVLPMDAEGDVEEVDDGVDSKKVSSEDGEEVDDGVDSKKISSEVDEVLPMDAERDVEEVDDGVDSKKVSSEDGEEVDDGVDSKKISPEVAEVEEVDEVLPMDAEEDGEEVDDGVDSKKISSEVDEVLPMDAEEDGEEVDDGVNSKKGSSEVAEVDDVLPTDAFDSMNMSDSMDESDSRNSSDDGSDKGEPMIVSDAAEDEVAGPKSVGVAAGLQLRRSTRIVLANSMPSMESAAPPISPRKKGKARKKNKIPLEVSVRIIPSR